ncbi:MAG: hypothetical protein ACOYUZ_04580 [Patescibacteria group bacterium]
MKFSERFPSVDISSNELTPELSAECQRGLNDIASTYAIIDSITNDLRSGGMDSQKRAAYVQLLRAQAELKGHQSNLEKYLNN